MWGMGRKVRYPQIFIKISTREHFNSGFWPIKSVKNNFVSVFFPLRFTQQHKFKKKRYAEKTNCSRFVGDKEIATEEKLFFSSIKENLLRKLSIFFRK